MLDAYEKKRAEHQDQVYKSLTDKLRLAKKTEKERKQKQLHPEDSSKALVEKTRLLLPQIVDITKDTHQGLINMSRVKNILHISQSRRSYRWSWRRGLIGGKYVGF